MTTTLASLEQECARASGWYISIVPTSGSSSTSFVANGAGEELDESDQSGELQHAWLRVESDSAATPLNVGEVRRVKTYTVASTTIALNTGRGFSNTPTVTMVIAVYKSVPPGLEWAGQPGWRTYINRVLRTIRFRRYTLLTLVTDGDMDTSGTSNWTAGGSATLSKITTAANVLLGTQSLRVQNAVADDYARSALLNVAARDVYCLRADVRVASGTATLQAYDQTNSAEIESESCTYRDWRSLDFTFTVPSGCHQVSVRLVGEEATADCYWDNVSLRPLSGRRLSLPSWVTEPGQVEGLVEYRGYSSQTEDVMALSQQLGVLRPCDILEDVTGATALLAQYEFQPQDQALLLVRGLAPYAELSATTDTTVADKDLVIAGARYYAYKDLYGPEDWHTKDAGVEFGARAAALPRAQRPFQGRV